LLVQVLGDASEVRRRSNGRQTNSKHTIARRLAASAPSRNYSPITSLRPLPTPGNLLAHALNLVDAKADLGQLGVVVGIVEGIRLGEE
jgi:hypothetical protein